MDAGQQHPSRKTTASVRHPEDLQEQAVHGGCGHAVAIALIGALKVYIAPKEIFAHIKQLCCAPDVCHRQGKCGNVPFPLRCMNII